MTGDVSSPGHSPSASLGFGPGRECLHAAARGLQELARAAGTDGFSDDFEAADQRLAGATFRLLVIGAYKRGKSTLVNALLGRPVLPAGVIPLTSVVTEIAHGDGPRLEVEPVVGETFFVPVDRLTDYVTEPGNPGNEKQVRRVVVRERGAWLAEGVRIVDTPGTGSIHGLNTRATYEALDEADAVVFVLAADQPVGDEERRLLEAVRPVTDRVLFVLNRVDLLTPEELDTALDFTRHQLTAACGVSEASLYPLSAREALAASLRESPPPPPFARFAERLHQLLVDDRAAILLDRTRRILSRAGDLLRCAVEAERDAARLEAGDLEEAIARFADGAARIRAREDAARASLRQGVARLLDQTLREAEERAARRVRAATWHRVEAVLVRADGSLYRTTLRLAEDIGDWVVGQLRALLPESERLVTAGFAELLHSYEQRVEELVGELTALAERVVGLRVPIPHATTSLDERPRFYFRDWDASGPVLPQRTWLVLRLPRHVAVRFARRWLAELMEKRITQNLAAMRYDWRRRLDDTQWRLEASSRRQLQAAAAIVGDALGRALQRKLVEGPQQAARAEELASLLRRLDEIQSMMAAGVGRGST